MEQSWSFINGLCASELNILNESCKLLHTETTFHSATDVFSFIENNLGQTVSSYSSMLEHLEKVYSCKYNLNEINLMQGHGDIVKSGIMKDVMSRFNRDTRCLSHILLWILLKNDDARDQVARMESIRNTSKVTFEREYKVRLLCSNQFVQKIPFYALSFSGMGEVAQQNNYLRWMTVSSATGLGMTAFTVASLLHLGYIGRGILENALDSLFSFYGKSDRKIKHVTPFWVTLIFIHLSSSMTISSELIAKDFCKGLINNNYLHVPNNFKFRKFLPTKREIFPGWNSIRIGLVVYLWGSLPKSGVKFRQQGNTVFFENFRMPDKRNSLWLEDVIVELLRQVPLRKLEELLPYTEVLIDYLYGLDVVESQKDKYIRVSKRYTALTGSKLLVDYCFPYTEIDSDTYCYCDITTLKGTMTQLYFDYKGIKGNHCINDLESQHYDCILVPPLSDTSEFEKFLSPKGKLLSIETKLENPKVVHIDQETEYAVVRHDIVKLFEAISMYIDLKEYDRAKQEVRNLKNWVSTYFMKKKPVAPVDIEKLLFKQFNDDFKVQIDKLGFSSTPIVMVNESDFKVRVLNNLVENFKRHAFASICEKEQREVRVKLTRYGQQTEIRISNNGEPIPENLSPDIIFDLGVKGKGSGHLGYGCWSMRRCLQCYDGDIRLETDKSLYPTTFIIILPNCINNED